MNIQPNVIVPYVGDSSGFFIGTTVVGRYSPTGQFPPFDVNYDGISSIILYGSQQGNPPVASRGTVRGVTSVVTVFNTDDGLSEHAAYGAYMTYLNHDITPPNDTPGRTWAFDSVLSGPREIRQSALGGFHSLINNYYDGLPLDNPSGAYWAITSPGFGGTQALRNYAIGVGYGVVGYGNGPTALGFMTGLQVGNGGSNWGTARSHVSTGVGIADCDAFGLLIIRKYSGVTYMAVSKAGSGYQGNPNARFSAPPSGYPATGFGILTPTSLDEIAVVNGGSGYSMTNPPAVVIDPPFPSGTPAEATANVNTAGEVESIDVDVAGFGFTGGKGERGHSTFRQN